VIKLFDKVLALPLIGTLDSARTQTVMETLLKEIVASGSEIAILDITGRSHGRHRRGAAPDQDRHGGAADGRECIISGIRPQIAQTIVHLGINLRTSSPRRRSPTRSRSRWKETGFPSCRRVRG
jgi:rsbT co-antagonist protein RsbR